MTQQLSARISAWSSRCGTGCSAPFTTQRVGPKRLESRSPCRPGTWPNFPAHSCSLFAGRLASLP